MYVKKYTLRLPDEGISTTATTISMPMGQAPWLAGQQEIIDRDFVDIEVEKSINAIFDYEKVRFMPRNVNGKAEGITYRIRLLDNGAYPSNTMWSDIGFIYDDFKFLKNSFTKSFLRLDFFDTDIGTSQRLLSFVTLFPKFIPGEYELNGMIPQPSNYELTFRLGNPILDRTVNGEGFFLYHFKDEVLPTVPKSLYMRATFANAKTGKVTRLMSSDNPNNGIDILARSTMNTNLVNQIYTKYDLKRDGDGYYYEIDENYSNNVSTSSNITTINLYEISAS
jgi:hypothetical protein